MSIPELMAQRAEHEAKLAELEAAIFEARTAEKTAAIATVNATIAQHGLTLSDINVPVGHISAVTGTARKRKSKASAPKYRDLASGGTWAGRGKRPAWLTAALDGGKTLGDFAIATNGRA